MTGEKTPDSRRLGTAIPLVSAAQRLNLEPEVLHLLTDARELSDLRLSMADPARPWLLESEVAALDPDESRSVLRAARALWTYLRCAEPALDRETAAAAHRPLWVRTGRRGSAWDHVAAVQIPSITDWLVVNDHVDVVTTRFRLEPLIMRSPWLARRLVIPAATGRQVSFPSFTPPDWVVEAMHMYWHPPGEPSTTAASVPAADPWVEDAP